LNLRVCNSLQGTVIVPDVTQVDTAREPVSIVARNLRDVLKRGLWLNPYRGVPQVGWIPALDIVYIDERFRVLWCIENYRYETTGLPEKFVSSALVLPSGCVNEARIQRGDQLELRDAATGLRWAGQAASDLAVENVTATPAIAARTTHDRRSRPEWSRKALFGWMYKSNGEPSTRRKAERHVIPGLVAYFPIASSPQPSEVRNISTQGFYALTEDRWMPGTSILVSLQIINPANRTVEAMISIPSKVVWLGPDGVGFTFDDESALRDRRIAVTNIAEWVQLRRFLQRIQR
jgi:hypothetical protein